MISIGQAVAPDTGSAYKVRVPFLPRLKFFSVLSGAKSKHTLQKQEYG